MDNINLTKTPHKIIDGLLYSAIKGGTLSNPPEDLELINIMNTGVYNKIAEEFIIAVIRRDENHVFYKYLLEVITPLKPGAAKLSICYRLVGDITTYLGEGLSGRLQLQLDTHNKIVSKETTPDEASERYTMTLAAIYPDTILDKIVKPGIKNIPRESMRVSNKISPEVAHDYSKRYCGGNRDAEVESVIEELDKILIEHSKLYIKTILTKLDETHCTATAIIHGINTVLPLHITVHDLDIRLWDSIIITTLKSTRNRYGIRQHSIPDHVLDKIRTVFSGTSTFSHRDLTSMILGYDSLETTDLVLKAVSKLRSEQPRSYFTPSGYYNK